MPFENNCTLQNGTWQILQLKKINMTPTNHGALQKWHNLRKKAKYYICQGLTWVTFKRKFLNLLYDSESWSWGFEIEIFPLQNNTLGALLCLIVVEVSSVISRVLVVLQKTNKGVVRCYLWWMGAILGRWYFW